MGSYSDDGYISRTMAIAGRLMMAVIEAVFTVVFYFLLKRIYARCFSGRSGSLRRHRLAFVGQHDPPRLQNVGLGKSAIEALPVFVYHLKSHKDGLQCAVCLCEFEDNEKGRLLPKCHHSFHIDCIDMWLHSHSTCPLCRASAQADTPADSVVVPLGEAPLESTSETEQEVSPVPEGIASISGEPDSDIDLCHSCTHDEVLPSPTYPWATQKAVSSVSNSAFFEQGTTSTSGQTLDKTVIDIPRQVDSFSSPRLFSGLNQQVFSPSDRSNSPVFVSVH